MSAYEKLLHNISPDLSLAWENLKSKPEELSSLLETLSSTVEHIKKLNEEKKISSAKIGRLKKSGEDISEIVQSQSTIKEQLKQLKQEKTQTESAIRFFFEDNNTNIAVPVRFTPFEGISSNNNDSNIHIISANELSTSQLDDYVASHTHATPYHFSCWRKLITSLFKHDDLSLAAVDAHNNIQGYLPLVRLKSRLFGDFITSMPYFNYGGPLANTTTIEQTLINDAIKIAEKHKLEHIECRELKPRTALISKQEKVSMIRKLPQSTELLSKELGTKLRAQIKRSDIENPTFMVGKLELLDDFYRVFATNMRDLGTPVYSKAFFSRVIESWYDKSHIVVIYTNNTPVACALLLGYKEVLEIPWASALKKTNRSGINMFMYWNILKFAIEQGYDFFDFGRSSKDSGTFNFKKQWGAEPYQNYWNYWLPDGEELPQINPNNTKYKLLIATWKKLPLFVSNTIGPAIVKNIP